MIPTLRAGAQTALEFHARAHEGAYTVSTFESGHEVLLGTCGYTGNPSGPGKYRIAISPTGVNDDTCTPLK